MQLDVLIFGGGAAGLWTLDALVRRGARAILLEADRLGAGQTIAAQGIIHGGLKYTLQGLLTPSAVEIRSMPLVWRECLAGRREPDLRSTRIRAPFCHLWRTDSLASRIGLIGARVGLSVRPQILTGDERPAVLSGCPGTVARLEEQVIATDSLLASLAARHRSRLLAIDPDAVAVDWDSRQNVRRLRIADRAGRSVELAPRQIVLTAGGGNADLRRRMGLADSAMQRRPLHMVLMRGDLPELNGHCVDGATTRVTITSDRDAAARRVWQVGGQIAELGTTLDEGTLLRRAQREIAETIPAIDLSRVEWSTYRVDRAEGEMPDGRRPETTRLLCDRNVWTAWPTKLALVPLLAEQIAEQLAPFDSASAATTAGAEWPGPALADWPRPEVAHPVWDCPRRWWRTAELTDTLRKAA